MSFHSVKLAAPNLITSYQILHLFTKSHKQEVKEESWTAQNNQSHSVYSLQEVNIRIAYLRSAH